MSAQRLDQLLTNRGLVDSRSQAESYIKLGFVKVDGQTVFKPGKLVTEKSAVSITADKKYVSRGGLKLASVAEALDIDFTDNVVLDVGSSTGGFSDYALQHNAAKVIAVDSGANQLHPKLRQNSKIELHERTDIRSLKKLSTKVDIALIDVSFTSIRPILTHVSGPLPDGRQGITHGCVIVAMVKPQFEAANIGQKHKGVIKNKAVRRQILKDFEQWASGYYKVVSKADSLVSGEKGNVERFYLLRLLE